jgi:hypothetical protein
MTHSYSSPVAIRKTIVRVKIQYNYDFFTVHFKIGMLMNAENAGFFFLISVSTA